MLIQCTCSQIYYKYNKYQAKRDVDAGETRNRKSDWQADKQQLVKCSLKLTNIWQAKRRENAEYSNEKETVEQLR